MHMHAEKITGPFGFWTFPVLNTLVSIFSNIASAAIPAPAPAPPSPAPTHASAPEISLSEPELEKIVEKIIYKKQQPVITNTEQWQWIDYKGQKRNIIVSRKVEQKQNATTEEQ